MHAKPQQHTGSYTYTHLRSSSLSLEDEDEESLLSLLLLLLLLLSLLSLSLSLLLLLLSSESEDDGEGGRSACKRAASFAIIACCAACARHTGEARKCSCEAQGPGQHVLCLPSTPCTRGVLSNKWHCAAAERVGPAQAPLYSSRARWTRPR